MGGIIVPVLNLTDQLGCVATKLTISKVAKPNVYPLPRIEELFATLGEVKVTPNWTLLVHISRYC